MENTELAYWLGEYGTITEGENGFWKVEFRGRELYVVTDADHNRMRIMSAIMPEWKLKKKHLEEILKAQFHKTLDVKYALYNGTVWSLFMHPLSPITKEQVEDAMSQVYWAAKNFGGSWQSSNLVFGQGDD